MADEGFEPKGPVDWALGKVLLETAFKPILYAVMPDRVDPRDWMRPHALKLASWRAHPTHSGDEVDDYWFDFVADTGDSDVAAYSLAYLFHGDLSVGAEDAALLGQDEPKLGEGLIPVTVDASATGTRLLPRGEFLFVGGDTAYPVADSNTICQRFVVPTNHAFARRFLDAAPDARSLLGIPGNHDWYDNLDGFNRTFREPAAPTVRVSEETWRPEVPHGHFAIQQASYFALELPGNWHFWALDAREGGDLDHRQRVHFAKQARRMAKRGTNASLLLATPNPARVDGHDASWLVELCDALPKRALGRLRLWFSGDTHHYARYEGVSVPRASSFTSLVNGLGGAALHAALKVEGQSKHVYPKVEEGESRVAYKLANPLHMLGRPGLRALGAFLGLFLGAGGIARARNTTEPTQSLEQVVGVVSGMAAPVEHGAVFLVSFLAVCSLLYRVLAKKPDEKEARRKPVAARVLSFLSPLVLVLLALVLIAQGERSFGDVVLDLTFDLVLIALLGLVPLLFATGQPKGNKSWGRGVLLVVLAWLLGAATIGGSVVVARQADAALLHAGWNEGALAAARAIGAPMAAAAVQFVVFPILAGPILALSFLLGTQRAFISSFATLDQYVAFIRFRLRVNKQTQLGNLTGFVIAVDRGVSLEALRRTSSTPKDAPVPTARIIDAFTVAGSSTSAHGA